MAHPKTTRFTPACESALAAQPVESLPRCPGDVRGAPGRPYAGLARHGRRLADRLPVTARLSVSRLCRKEAR